MTIVIATSSLYLIGGGISSYAHDLLQVYGLHNKVIVLTGDSYTKNPDDFFEVYNMDWNNWSISNAKYTIELIEKLKPDVIINSKASLISLISPYLNDYIKIISISHFVNGTLADIAGFNSKYVDQIVSLSNFGKKYIENKFKITDPDKIQVIYNFVHQMPNADFILNEKIKNQNIKIVYPGGSALPKSPAIVTKILISLIKTDLNFTFYWIGNTTLPISWLFRKKKTIREIIPNDNRIVFTNRLSRQDAQKVIESANIFLLPSIGEGCPISLLEAMRIGVIPIVSDSKHASREIIKNGENGFVFPLNSIDIFVDTIKDIICNPINYEGIYHNSFKTFKSDFNESNWKKKMDDIMSKENNHTNRVKFKSTNYLKKCILFKYILALDRYAEISRSVRNHIIFRKLRFEIKTTYSDVRYQDRS